MITLSYTRQSPDHYTGEIVATFGTMRQPLTIAVSGTAEQVREKCRREFGAHIRFIAAMFCELPASSVEMIAARAAMWAIAKDERADHVTLARELERVNVTALIPHYPAADYQQGYELKVLWANTLDQLANGPQSLWVRGPIEMLDGSIVKPWLTVEKAAA